MRMRILWPLAAALVACSGPAVQPGSVQPAAADDAGAATITARDIHARIAFLASDALKGRDTPSQGLETAAAYIASEYERLGLEPHGDNGTYLQRYPFAIRTLQMDSIKLAVITRGTTTTFTNGADLFAMPGIKPNAVGDVVFAMSPITAGATTTGKILVTYVPGAMDRAWRTNVTQARVAAQTAGATGMIVVVDPTIDENMMRGRSTFRTSNSVTAAPPTVFLRYDRARDLLNGAGQNLDMLITRPGQTTPLSGVNAQIAVPVNDWVQYPPNVVAVLPGSDPQLKNTYVVLSGHMDHIGVGRPDARGDSINNGADDDASGTSAVMEVAEAFASRGQKPLRSIIFLNVSGEEKGLLGSSWFSEHPVVPLASIVADINIDMISRNNPDSVVAIGQDYSSLGPLTQEVARRHPELHLTVSRDIWPQERFFFRSDHFNFARKDVPAIFFFTGVHEDYHRPSDEVQKIDADKAARITKLVYYLAGQIANGREPPKWTEQGLKEVHALTR